MDINIGDIIIMRKPHPCGGNQFYVKRIGADFKIVCTKCSHEVFVPRAKIEKSIKQIIPSAED